jgi:uncharacterized damage-inducible protein DinB
LIVPWLESGLDIELSGWQRRQMLESARQLVQTVASTRESYFKTLAEATRVKPAELQRMLPAAGIGLTSIDPASLARIEAAARRKLTTTETDAIQALDKANLETTKSARDRLVYHASVVLRSDQEKISELLAANWKKRAQKAK